MKSKNPNPRPEVCATKGLLLIAAVRYIQLFKIFIISFIFFGLTLQLKAQDTITSYFDENWEIATKNEFEYYRKCVKLNKSKWLVLDYYKEGNIQMKGFYSEPSAITENGNFLFFYDNGNIKSEGMYIDGKLVYEWKYFNYNGNIDKSGFYKDDKMNGVWKWYHDNQQISSEELYENDSLISSKYYDKLGNLLTGDVQSNVMPSYPGGMNNLYKFLSKKLKYPKNMKRQAIQGKVTITFVITELGKVEGVCFRIRPPRN